MNLSSRYLARLVAVVAAGAAATLLSLSPASATPRAPHATRLAAASATAREAVAHSPLRGQPAVIASAPSCAALGPELARLARAGLTRVACASPAGQRLSPDRATMMDAAASDVCRPGTVVRTRHASCAMTTIDYQVLQVPGKQVLGTGTIAVGYQETLSATSRTWPLVAQVELLAATGVVSAGTTTTMGVTCTGGCGSTARWAQPLARGQTYSHTFTVSSRGSETEVTSQQPAVDIVNAQASAQAAPLTLSSLGPARCDSDPLLEQAGTSTSGCVFNDVAASYDVYLSGHGEDQVAQNVQAGETTGSLHFGWYGHGQALVRAPSDAAARNEAAACAAAGAQPPDSCAQYPFAATYQGAYYFPDQNVTMQVPSTQNATEDGLRNAMYVSERLLAGDSYWVFVLP